MKHDRSLRRKRVIAALALNVYSGQRKLAGMTDFFNAQFTREDLKWDMDILSGYERLTDATIRRYVKEGVDGFLLLCHPPAETIRALARTELPCIIETAAEVPFDPALISSGSSATRANSPVPPPITSPCARPSRATVT